MRGKEMEKVPYNKKDLVKYGSALFGDNNTSFS
jgi:hypothetical protein